MGADARANSAAGVGVVYRFAVTLTFRASLQCLRAALVPTLLGTAALFFRAISRRSLASAAGIPGNDTALRQADLPSGPVVSQLANTLNLWVGLLGS